MTPAQTYTAALAVVLSSSGRTLTGNDLVAELRRWGLDEYEPGRHYKQNERGIYSHITSVYRELTRLGRHTEAEAVALAFTNKDKKYAYAA